MALITDWLAVHALRRPYLLRNVVGALRHKAPILQLGNTLVVLGDAGVREVFGRPRDFINGTVYAPKLKLGPLVLGMDDSCRYRAERAVAERALARPDIVARFTRSVREGAQACLESTLAVGRVDFVVDLVEPTFAAAFCELFGIDARGARSEVLRTQPGLRTLIEWMRKLGGAIGSSVPAPFGMEGVADDVSRELEQYLSSQLGSSEDPIVVAIRQQLGADNVVRFVGGTLSAAAAMFKTATLAMHQLLERGKLDELLAPHQPAAPAVIDYVWEALRFDPPFPFLSRYCPRETTLQGKVVPGGATVWISLLSAMFDPDAVKNPDEFSAQRPAGSYNVFGLGIHSCVGLELARGGLQALFEEFIGRLRAQALRVRGPGKIRYDGAAVARYVIELEKSSVLMEIVPDAPRSTDNHRAVCPRNAA